MAINCPRRYYLLQRLDARSQCESALEGVWRWKQESQPGTPLPGDFPYLTDLAAAGYTMVEDLDGATLGELATLANFTQAQARVLLTQLRLFKAAACAALLAPP